MTQEINPDFEADQPQSRIRTTKPFPTMTFNEVLLLSKGILEHSVDGEIQRTTLFGKLNRSPNSGPSRNLITNSSKYGLTIGSYASPSLSLTDNGRAALDVEESLREATEKQFQLAISQFEPFDQLYEKLKNRRLPDHAVMRDELGRVKVAEYDRDKAAEVFTANLRFLGLVQDISGIDHVRSIEQVLDELPTTTDDGPPEPQSDEPPIETVNPAEGNGNAVATSNRPALHIDIQVHIDPTSSAEQIDHIFASMARHFYRLES